MGLSQTWRDEAVAVVTDRLGLTETSVERAHAKLGALLQTAVDHDSQATPDGFRDARKLGLIDGANPALTPAGRAALVLLGVWVPNG